MFWSCDAVLRKQATRRVTGSLCCFIGLLLFCYATQGSQTESGEILHKKILAGEQVTFKRSDREDARRIDAAWIREAALNHVPIHVDGGIIRGRLGLRYVVLDEEVDFEQCIFEDEADFSYAVFKRRLVVNGTTFRQLVIFDNAAFNNSATFTLTEFAGGAEFQNSHALDTFGIVQSKFATGTVASFHYAQFARIAIFNLTDFKCDTYFYSARFADQANFRLTRFGHVADFQFAQFASDAVFVDAVFEGKALFTNLRVLGDATFARSKSMPAATFRGESNFAWAEIDGVANYDRVVFEKIASFTGIKIGRAAGFTQSHFEGGADFSLALIGGSAFFRGALFKGKTVFNRSEIKGFATFGSESRPGAARFDGDVDFNLLHIGEDAGFDHVEFKNVMRFEEAEVGGRANFSEAQFLAGSKPSFRGTVFHREAWFQGTHFEEDATFASVQFDSEVRFSGATFGETANFAGTRFAAPVYFNRGTGPNGLGKFAGTDFRRVLFDGALFERDVRFDDSTFGGPASFRETKFREVYFSGDGLVPAADGEPLGASERDARVNQFRSTLDLRGATYDRIAVAWRDILGKGAPYDRQPYTVLEKVLRAAGKDDEADDVYLARRHAERRQIKWARSKISWFLDWVWWGANYGVLSWRLLYIPVCIVLIAALIFRFRSGAVKVDTKAGSAETDRFTFLDSARLSVRIFLPLEIPLDTRWQPSDERFMLVFRYSDIAAFLKFLGWIVVPLWVIIITGLLRYVAQ